MSIEIEIAGHGGYLKIEILEYENPSAQDLSDANWLSCNVIARVGAFSSSLNASFTTHDFVQFRNELQELMAKQKSTASFITDEEQLSLRVDMGNAGIVSVEGTLQTYDMPRASLVFSFESDMSFLAKTISGLRNLVKELNLI